MIIISMRFNTYATDMQQIKVIISHDDIHMVHVNVNELHVNMIFLSHFDLNLACRGHKYKRIGSMP